MASGIVGRNAELASVRAFVGSIADGAAALLLEGEAGMGKTTLWNAALEHAGEEGMLVLRARPSASETTLSFAGVGDLLDAVLDSALAPLPDPQRRALARALVLDEGEGPAPDPHAVGLAVRNALRALAGERPVVLAVDDVQWLDAASAGALAYATRRLGPERVGVLVTRRSGLESGLVDELRSLRDGRLAELTVGPLDVSTLHRVLHHHLGAVLPRPLLAEVHAAAGGNPFYALEIVRTLRRSGASVEAGHPLPVPESLHDLVHDRIRALSPASRDFLLAAAAHAHPTVAITEEASGVSREAGLRPALEARVVELEGDRIRFTHPLLAAGAYEVADELRRTEIHARLAELLDDPEARAWQLAASATERDEDVAGVLEEAARHARARGAPRAGALLLDRAHGLTPAGRAEDASRRAIDASYLHFESGDSPRAEEQLRDVIATLPAGTTRSRALMRLARVRSYENQREAAELFEQAIAEAGDDRQVLAVAHEGVAACLFRLRERLAAAVDHASLAATIAQEFGDDALCAEALGTQTLAEAILGRPAAAETARRALELDAAASEHRVIGQPLFALAVYWWWQNDLRAALDAGRTLARRSRELGDESSLPYLLVVIGQGECHLGELDAAYGHAVEGQELAEQSGQRTTFVYCRALEALVEAYRGHAERARALAREALDGVDETAGRPAELVARAALGHLELARTAPAPALESLAPIVEHARVEEFGEPSAMWFVVDAIEALVALDRTDEATDVLGWYEGRARSLDRPAALANCLRSRGLLAAQAGRLDEAVARCSEALELHARVELPLDRGRTLLVLGTTLRRAKRRREARQRLEEAYAAFERIGARAWAQRAQAELRRISGRAPSLGALTPAEERVAALVAEGKTNREVAAALFLSDRTVEGHLSRIFGKLGIRHRAELAGALAARQTQGDAAPNAGDVPVSAAPSAP